MENCELCFLCDVSFAVQYMIIHRSWVDHSMTYFDTLFKEIYFYIALENIARKGEIACDKQFLLFSQCFLLYRHLVFILN